jgi:hypothetical protein
VYIGVAPADTKYTSNAILYGVFSIKELEMKPMVPIIFSVTVLVMYTLTGDLGSWLKRRWKGHNA